MSSRIGRGTVIRGAIRGEGDIELEGRVDGAIAIDGELVLTESAMVRVDGAALQAQRLVVRGAVAGDLRASAGIVLEEGARVVGDLSAPAIGIRPGALLRGHVSTEEGAAAPKATSARKAAEPAARPAPARETISREAPARAELRPAPSRAAVTVREPAVARPAPPRAFAVETARTQPAPPVEAPRPAAAPAPVMPALRKGAKGQVKKKAGGR